MAIKSSQTLVSEALSEVKTITADEALKQSNEGTCTLIDIRENGFILCWWIEISSSCQIFKRNGF